MPVGTAAAFTGSFPDVEVREGRRTLYVAPEGGWVQVNEPKAFYDPVVDATFFAWVNREGDIRAGKLDHATGLVTTSTAHVLLDADLHAGPAIYQRQADGHIVIAYSSHDDANLYRRISSNPRDISSWGAETNLDASLGGTDYTYPSLLEYGGVLWLFYRDYITGGAGTGKVAYSTSADGGVTWAAQTILVSQTNHWSYHVVSTDGSRIDVAVSDGNGVNDAGTSTYHLYYDGAWRKSDGTSLGSPPLTHSQLTLVLSGATDQCWPQDVSTSGSLPAILITTYPAAADSLYRYARWTGSAWAVETAASALDPLWALGALSREDPERWYGVVTEGGRQELHRFRKVAGGWADVPLTGGSGLDNIYPAAVHGAAAIGPAVLWLHGTETTYLDFDLGIQGSR